MKGRRGKLLHNGQSDSFPDFYLREDSPKKCRLALIQTEEALNVAR